MPRPIMLYRDAVIQSLENRTLFSTYALASVAPFASPPSDALVMDSAGNLYGATTAGGTNGDGSIYEVSGGTNVAATLASFGGGSGGSTPIGPMAIDSTGDLFGVTAYGGANGLGSIYELPHGGTSIVTLTSFDGVNGATPGHAGVILDSSGDIFGATSGGGNTGGDGVVYELPHGSYMIDTLATFAGGDSGNPQGRLVLNSSGELFGTTRSVGGNGTVYEVAAGSGTITTLVTFNGSDGQYPSGVMVSDSAGDLFGTTQNGGAHNGGTVFEVPANTTNLVTLVSFDASRHPVNAGLVLDSSGNLFGTTSSDSINTDGTVFEVAHGTGTAVTLAALDLSIGQSPSALISDGAGGFFGVTQGGSGSVFRLTQSSTGPQATQNYLQVSSSSVAVGQSVTFTAYLSSATPLGEVPTGTVTFTNSDGAVLGTAMLDVTGTANLTLSSLAIGNYAVSASYGGDANSLSSSSAAQTVTVAADTYGPFSDSFAASSTRPAGTSLGVLPVESSPSDSWISSGADDFVFSSTTANTLTASDTGTDVARVYRALQSGTYTVAANLWPGTDSADPWVGVGFLDSGKDPATGDPLILRIQSAGQYELDAQGTGGSPVVLASGTLDASTWSASSPPRVDLTWNTAAGVATASINGVAIATNLDLSIAGANSSDVNSVGFFKQGGSDDSLAISNFNFGTNAEPSTTALIGQLDPTFGSGGLASNNLGFTQFVGSASDGAGTLVLGDAATGFAVARLDTDGSVDQTFGTHGIVSGSFGNATDTAAAITVLDDNTILVAGTANGSLFAVEHFSSTGAAIGSTVLNPFAAGSTDVAHAMAVAPDGTIYLAGQSNGDFAVAAIDETGAAVSSFGANGIATVDLGGDDDAYAVGVQSNGRVVLAGETTNSAGVGSVALARFRSDGTLDKSFHHGTVTSNFRGLDDGVDTIAFAKGGKIIVGGWSADSDTSCSTLLAEYTATGHLIKAFGGVVNVPLSGDTGVTQIAIDGQGNVDVAGKEIPGLGAFDGDTNVFVLRFNQKGKSIALQNDSPYIDLDATAGGTVPTGVLKAFETSGNGTLQLPASGNLNLLADAGGQTTEGSVIGSKVELQATFANKLPTKATAGKRLHIAIWLTENGNLPVKGQFNIAYSLAPDGLLIDAIAIHSATVNVSLKPNKHRVYRTTLTLPANLQGNYTLVAHFAGLSDLSVVSSVATSALIAITPGK